MGLLDLRGDAVAMAVPGWRYKCVSDCSDPAGIPLIPCLEGMVMIHTGLYRSQR